MLVLYHNNKKNSVLAALQISKRISLCGTRFEADFWRVVFAACLLVLQEKFKREFRQRLRLCCPQRWEAAASADNNSTAYAGTMAGADNELSDFDKSRTGGGRTSMLVNGSSLYRSVSVRGTHNVHYCTGMHHHNSPRTSNHLHVCHHQNTRSQINDLDF